MVTDEEKKAKLYVNYAYHKAANAILALSTGTLVLSVIFLRDIIGISGRNVIGGYLHGIISSWISFLLSIGCCLFFYFFSAKHLQSLHNIGLVSKFWKKHSESLFSWAFWLSATFFGFGVLYLIVYVYLIYFRFY